MSIKIQNSRDLGRLVRETRKRLRLTQPQLALAANVGVRFIVELEAGKSTLRLENILRVLQALGGVLLSLIHISEPTRPLYISYAVFCLKKIFFF